MCTLRDPNPSIPPYRTERVLADNPILVQNPNEISIGFTNKRKKSQHNLTPPNQKKKSISLSVLQLSLQSNGMKVLISI